MIDVRQITPTTRLKIIVKSSLFDLTKYNADYQDWKWREPKEEEDHFYSGVYLATETALYPPLTKGEANTPGEHRILVLNPEQPATADQPAIPADVITPKQVLYHANLPNLGI